LILQTAGIESRVSSKDAEHLAPETLLGYYRALK